MKSAYMATVIEIAIAALLVTGCGGGGDGGPQSDLTSYLPMAVGNNWSYDLRIRADLIVPTQAHPGWNVFVQTEEITGTALLQGTSYFVFQITRLANATYPELAYAPQYRRVDAQGVHARYPADPADFTLLQTPPQVGDTWADGVFPNITYETVAIGEQVTVPAGTFDCVKVEMFDPDALSGDGEYRFQRVDTWFAQGVGIVKDETWEQKISSGQWELLSDIKLREYEIL